jgi:hypothetical protein
MTRWLPKSIPFLVVSIALYFTIHFGIEAVRILASPVHGLDLPGFAHVVHGIGRRFGLEATGLIRTAAFLGALKLSVATLFAVYLVSRTKSLLGHETDHEVVDAAVLLVASVTIIAATPALFDGEMDLLGQYRLPLWLGGLAVTLSMIERVIADEKALERVAAARQRFTVYDVTLPPKRNGVSTLRWDALRCTANVAADPVTIWPQQPIRL